MTMQTLSALLAAALLAGCASLNSLSSDVSSHSLWPAERKAGSYAFERLPSQQAQADTQARLEDAARPALAAAGFTSAPDAAGAEYVVQLGARLTAYARSPWDDPFWWRGGAWFGGRRGGYWVHGPFWPRPSPTYEREVAILIRDRKTGQSLYETRASNDGMSPAMESLLPAMYAAALADFPSPAVNPRRVVTQIAPTK